MLTADSPLGRLLKHMSACAPRRYPPTRTGRLIAALAGQPIPNPDENRDNAAVQENHPCATRRRPE